MTGMLAPPPPPPAVVAPAPVAPPGAPPPAVTGVGARESEPVEVGRVKGAGAWGAATTGAAAGTGVFPMVIWGMLTAGGGPPTDPDVAAARG